MFLNSLKCGSLFAKFAEFVDLVAEQDAVKLQNLEVSTEQDAAKCRIHGCLSICYEPVSSVLKRQTKWLVG